MSRTLFGVWRELRVLRRRVDDIGELTAAIGLEHLDETQAGGWPQHKPQPKRRKGHLALHLGGGALAALAAAGGVVRDYWRHPGAATALTAGASATTALLYLGPLTQGDGGPGPDGGAVPTATATQTSTPSPTAPIPPSQDPSSPAPTASEPPGPTTIATDPAPAPGTAAAPGATADGGEPEAEPAGPATPTVEPDGGRSAGPASERPGRGTGGSGAPPGLDGGSGGEDEGQGEDGDDGGEEDGEDGPAAGRGVPAGLGGSGR